jgi:catechol 2,3-dioxygenase-like lactoylglutathione lyase family enzyme
LGFESSALGLPALRRAYHRHVITAVHLLIYSDDAPATRAFLRDVLGWQYVADRPPGDDWLIFRSGPSEMGVHPTFQMHEGRPYSTPRHHSISLMCDDVAATRTDLEARGAEFSGDIEDLRFGRGVNMKVPGADDILLYEPKHPEAFDL